jgi:hypothetical protein
MMLIYVFTVAPGANKVILDIDYDTNKGKYFDSIIELYDESGTLLAEADDAPTRSGQDGSASNYDAYLELIIDKPGRYYVKVAAFYGKPIPAGVAYILQVTVENHAVSGSAQSIEDNNEG